MALDKNRLGNAIWAAVKQVYGPYTPAISPFYEQRGIDLWTAVADEIIKEIDQNADIVLTNANIHIEPGTFKVNVPAFNVDVPVTGQAEQVAVTLSGKIE